MTDHPNLVTTAAAIEAPRLLPLGDAALTVEFGSAILPSVHARVLGFAAVLQRELSSGMLEGVLEWVPTFRSVTVHFDCDRIDSEALGQRLLVLWRTAGSLEPAGARWLLPVCFEGADFAPDLDELAAAKGLSRERIIELLLETEFNVYLLGFLPGFAYLGGLPEALEMPRLASPRQRVPAGSVAVAQRLCAAYPCDSPGGWRLLGRTPVPLFDAAGAARPALLAPGDRVRWQRVDRAGYAVLERDCADGAFDRDRLLCAASADGLATP